MYTSGVPEVVRRNWTDKSFIALLEDYIEIYSRRPRNFAYSIREYYSHIDLKVALAEADKLYRILEDPSEL
jgi:hypothetical protein